MAFNDSSFLQINGLIIYIFETEIKNKQNKETIE